MAFYLAMTAAEMMHQETLPENPAWMGCHFSPYGTGLSNLPDALPQGAMLIINDRTPIHGHNPSCICAQTEELVAQFQCSSVLLDFQRPESPETAKVAEALVQCLSCPVAVSQWYAKELDCPVFLSAPPLWTPLEAHLAPWAGRTIFLEAALESAQIPVTYEGASYNPIPLTQADFPHWDEALCCHYQIQTQEDRILFTLTRTPEDFSKVLAKAEALGVTQMVGLYQQFGHRR